MGAQQFQYPQRPAAKQPRRQILDPSKALPYRGGQVIQRSLTRKFAQPAAASGRGVKVGPGGKLLAPRPQSAADQQQVAGIENEMVGSSDGGHDESKREFRRP